MRSRTHSDVEIKTDKGISGPTKTIEEGSQREKQWHELHTLCLNHQPLKYMKKSI